VSGLGYLQLIGLTVISWPIFTKLRLPSPTLIGPMLAVGAAELAGWDLPQIPAGVYGAFQIILGLYLGLKINREQVKALRQLAGPTGLVVAWTILSTIVMAWLLVWLTGLDTPTALLGATPGGLAEMSILALSYDADVPAVALLQLFRLILIIVLIPPLAVRVNQRQGETTTSAPANGREETVCEAESRDIPLALLSGVIPGTAFLLLGVPAGGLIGGLVGLGLFKTLGNKEFTLPRAPQVIAQLGIGATVGLKFTPQLLGEFTSLLIAVVIYSLIVVVSGIGLAYVMRRQTKWDLATCLLCSAPGGLMQMAIIAEDLGADSIKVSLLQLIRLLTIVLLMPWFFNFMD